MRLFASMLATTVLAVGPAHGRRSARLSHERNRVSPSSVLFFPFRVLRAIVYFLNFFSMSSPANP